MAGHIFLISCLLAICLPIIFVQLPRFETVKDLRAENEAEKRSEVLRRRPLSPSRKALRRITRPWSEIDADITSAESEQGQVDPEQIAQTAARGRWDKGDSRTPFGADACADGGASSKEEELRKARAGKKPWDLPFRRQLPRTELVRKSPGGRWHAVTDAPLPRKTGQDMEAADVAVRLFPPDPVPELDDVDEYDRCSQLSSSVPQTPQEPLYRRPPPKNQLQSFISRRSLSPPRVRSENPSVQSTPRIQSEITSVQSTPQQQSDLESLPSPLDNAQLHHMCHHTCHCHTPRSTPPVKTKEHRSVPCRYSGSGLSTPQSQIRTPIAEAPKDSPKAIPTDEPKEVPKCTTEETSKEASKEAVKGSSKAPQPSLPLWQVLLVTMGFIIFVFAFAVLVAHCLAWFLVYKTEARLGKVRSGLLKGGEMKLCLCGRG